MYRARFNLLTLTVLAVPASVQAFTWPGPAPCDTTLAACLSAVPSSSVVEIATAGPIDEMVSASKSLTLRAAPGFKPVFAPSRSSISRTPPRRSPCPSRWRA